MLKNCNKNIWHDVLKCKKWYSSMSSTFITDANKTQVTTYARPDDLVITRGSGCYLFDDFHKKEYIDFTSGIAVTALGHCNPEIANIIYQQSANKIVHSSNLYHNQEALKLSKLIVSKTKEFDGQNDVSKVFFCNSGTEANEAAIKFAKKYSLTKSPSKTKFIAFENSFHGRTMGALSVTYNPKYRTPFGDLIPGVEFATLQDIMTKFQGKLDLAKEDVYAGCIIEPIQGEGGVFPVPVDTLVTLKSVLQNSKFDIPLIYDEIQCGMGRTGKLWAHSYLPKEAHPDIFTVAKALGNGFPIAATCVNDKINDALKVGDHGTTYGGNPLACAISNYVVSAIADKAFLSQVNQKGAKLMSFLKDLQSAYPDLITDVRGKGLMIGCEFKEAPTKLIQKCKENGLLVITAGKSTVRFVPALIIDDETLEKGLEIFVKSLKQVYE